MIRVAVVGAGHWGPNLIRNFHTGHTSEVAWVADRDLGRLAQLQKRFPTIRVTEDSNEVIRDASVDAVIVATPSSTHHPIAKAALEAGKHVLVEKPIATSAAHAEELCELAERNRRVLLVGHVFLHNPAVQLVKRYVDEGHLGGVHYVSMVRTNLGPIRMDVDAAWDLAAHDISIANYWLGTEPTSVHAVGGSWINGGIADVVFLTFRYPKDVLVHVHASWLNPRKDRLITVVGDRRMLTFDDMSALEPVKVYDKQVTDERTQTWVDTYATFRASVRDGDVMIPKVVVGEPLKAECDHFLECIATSKTPLSGGRGALGVVKALEAVARSMQQGGKEEPVNR